MRLRGKLIVLNAAKVSLWLSAVLAMHFGSQNQMLSAIGHKSEKAYVVSQLSAESKPVRITGTAFPEEDPAGQKSAAVSYRLALLAGVLLPAVWVLRHSFKRTT